ncbi:MerR family transcriptional regulator [Persicobacter diffluens]|uniref:HTH merR-type domain-containing protein n=1 Tax=Persicobacter diffluens TaxID=981 RepID=A0AAN4VZ34_9BACT|nr:hypothetical protein PEDI_32660 [Persicobacter diffluens]
MEAFNIIEVEQLTGIKAHTLRIWEQRYAFLSPGRDELNTRWYSTADLLMILEIALLKDHNHRISTIVSMPEVTRKEKVSEILNKLMNFPTAVMGLLIGMAKEDHEEFERILASLTLKYGIEKTITDAIYPLLMRTGMIWGNTIISSGQENMVRDIVRYNLSFTVKKQELQMVDHDKHFMFFLPPGEEDDLAMIFAQFLVQREGNKVTFINEALPTEHVIQKASLLQADCVLSILNNYPDSFLSAQGFVDQLGDATTIPVLLSGSKMIGQGIIEPEKISIFNKFQDLIDFMEEQRVSVCY